jgi:hypothetical protein
MAPHSRLQTLQTRSIGNRRTVYSPSGALMVGFVAFPSRDPSVRPSRTHKGFVRNPASAGNPRNASV